MSYIGDSINASPTIAERAGAAIPGGAGLAVKYDANGCIVRARRRANRRWA